MKTSKRGVVDPFIVRDVMEAARAADAVLLSATGLPGVRYPDGTEIVPQIPLRILLGLYAGVRPAVIPEGWPTPLAAAGPVDFVLVRESTEGLFHTMGQGLVTEDRAEETLRITRETTAKLSAFAFGLAPSGVSLDDSLCTVLPCVPLDLPGT